MSVTIPTNRNSNTPEKEAHYFALALFIVILLLGVVISLINGKIVEMTIAGVVIGPLILYYNGAESTKIDRDKSKS